MEILKSLGIELIDFKNVNQVQADSFLQFTLLYKLMKIPLNSLPPVEERTQFIEDLTEGYFTAYGKFPKSTVLNMMSDYLLSDYIKDKNKTKADELQFLTVSQEKRRLEKEFSTLQGNLDFFYTRDTLKLDSLKAKETKIYKDS